MVELAAPLEGGQGALTDAKPALALMLIACSNPNTCIVTFYFLLILIAIFSMQMSL